MTHRITHFLGVGNKTNNIQFPHQLRFLSGLPTVSSPTKRIHVRSELLTQLSKVSDLLEKGYITQEHHDKIHEDNYNERH